METVGETAKFITSSDWAAISGLLTPFWVLLGAMLGLAFSMLLAQGMIPSLKASRDLPDPRLARLRQPLYGTAVLFFALAVAMVVVIVARVDILGEIFSDRLT